MADKNVAPCPFCGNGGRSDPRHVFSRTKEFVAVECGACGALGPFVRARATEAEELALGAWNRRAPLPTAGAAAGEPLSIQRLAMLACIAFKDEDLQFTDELRRFARAVEQIHGISPTAPLERKEPNHG